MARDARNYARAPKNIFMNYLFLYKPHSEIHPYENPYEVIVNFSMEMYRKSFKNNFCYEIHTFNIGKSFYIAKPLFETVCMFPDLL